jgi:hypothetical protein
MTVRELSLAVLIGCLLSGEVAAQPLSRSSDDPDRVTYSYQVRLYNLTPDIADHDRRNLKRYPEYIDRRDVIILSPGTYTVRTPIETDGGDVLIFADRLILEAPIDTRLRLNHSVGLYQLDCPPGQTPTEWMGDRREAYDDFFLKTNEIWDMRRQQYVTTRSQVYPELPPPYMPCVTPGRSIENKQFPVHLLNPDAVRSGNITIFARVVEPCPDCFPVDPKWVGYKPEQPERQFTATDRTLLNARGLRGSRGAPGLVACPTREDRPCPYSDILPPIPNERISDLRSGYTRGAPGGTVRISYLNNPGQASREATPLDGRLQGRILAGSGQLGATTEIDIDCRRLRRDDTILPIPGQRWSFICTSGRGRTWFRQTEKLDETPADDSEVYFVEGNPLSALAETAQILAALEIGRVYNYSDLLANYDHGLFIQNLSPTDQLESFLLKVLRISYSDLLTRMQRSNDDPSGGGAGTMVPPMLANLGEVYKAHPDMSDKQKYLIDLIRSVSRPVNDNKDSVIKYLGAIGGAMRTGNERPFETFNDYRMVEQVVSVREEVSRIVPALQNIRLAIFDGVTQRQREQLQRRVNDLQEAVRKAEDQAKADNDLNRIAGVLRKLQEIGNNSLRMYTQVSAGSPDAFGSASAIVTSISDIQNILQGDSVDPEKVRRLLATVIEAYNRFEEEAREMRDAILRERRRDVERVLRASQDASRLAQEYLVLMPDLIRGSIVNFRDNGSLSMFDRNMAGVKSIAELGPLNVPLTPRELPRCSIDRAVEIHRIPSHSGDITCVLFRSTDSFMALFSQSRNLSFFDNIPILVFSPNDVDSVWNLHGIYSSRTLDVRTAPQPFFP